MEGNVTLRDKRFLQLLDKDTANSRVWLVIWYQSTLSVNEPKYERSISVRDWKVSVTC